MLQKKQLRTLIIRTLTMNKRGIMVFDWETDGVDPYSCNPVELAAVPVDPRTLEVKEDRACRRL